MKDNTRATVMVCTAAGGTNVPLAAVGKPEKIMCFRFCGNKPPLPYTKQRNAWFDRTVAIWWLKIVFWPFNLKIRVMFIVRFYLIIVVPITLTKVHYLKNYTHFSYLQTLQIPTIQ